MSSTTRRFDYAEARRLYTEERLSLGEIGRRLNVSYTAVGDALDKLGVPRRPQPVGGPRPKAAVSAAEIVRLYREGWSLEALSKQYKACPRRIRGIIARQGVDIRPRFENTHGRGRDFDRDEAVRLYASGMAVEAVARQLRVSPNTVRRVLHARSVTFRQRGRERKNRDWTPAEIVRLYVDEQMPVQAVAGRLAIGVTTVRRYLAEAGVVMRAVPKPAKRDERDEQTEAMRACQLLLADLQRAHPDRRYPSVSVAAGIPVRIGPALSGSLTGSAAALCAELAR